MRHADDNIYCINTPYPPIKVEKKNLRYVSIILQDYSGMVSEYSAISQYIYHKFKLFNDSKYEKIATSLNGIAMVEMHHLEILANLIVALGGDPRYWINRKDKKYYWDAKFVDYGDNLKDFLTYDIQAEITAIRGYKKTIEQISDCNIIKIIERIILDEELHLSIFNNLYDEFIKKK